LILQELIKVTDELIKIQSKKKNVFSHAQSFTNKKQKMITAGRGLPNRGHYTPPPAPRNLLWNVSLLLKFVFNGGKNVDYIFTAPPPLALRISVRP
jgi:hypothetical protein